MQQSPSEYPSHVLGKALQRKQPMCLAKGMFLIQCTRAVSLEKLTDVECL